MDKINTVIPYPEDMEERISNEGAIVDMSNLKFEGHYKENEIKYSFIYLRNTGYENIDLDFSKVDYEKKSKFLLDYMKSDIIFNCKELVQSWLSIILHSAGVEVEGIFNILNKEEEQKFLEENRVFIKDMCLFINSLPLYLLYRIKTIDFSMEDIMKSDNVFSFGNNINFLINQEHINLLFIADDSNEPIFFNNYFTEDNNDLFESLVNLDFYQTLLSLSEMNSEDWNKLVEQTKKKKKSLQ